MIEEQQEQVKTCARCGEPVGVPGYAMWSEYGDKPLCQACLTAVQLANVGPKQVKEEWYQA